METQEKQKISIYEAAIEEFNEKGMKFTMDDIAKRLHISKKTLYNVFHDKEELFLETIRYGFAAVKESERKILENPNLSLTDKIRKIIIVLPDRYQNVDLRRLSEMKEKYPAIYRQVETRIENDWEPTLHLLQQGIEEGVIRKLKLPVLKAMIEASIEHFLNSDILVQQHISYEAALEEMMDIVMKGITA